MGGELYRFPKDKGWGTILVTQGSLYTFIYVAVQRNSVLMMCTSALSQQNLDST